MRNVKIVLDALYAWAEADALTQTKPCAKTDSYLVAAVSGRSQTVRNPSDSQGPSNRANTHDAFAYGYYLTLVDFNNDDPKHKKNPELDK